MKLPFLILLLIFPFMSFAQTTEVSAPPAATSAPVAQGPSVVPDSRSGVRAVVTLYYSFAKEAVLSGSISGVGFDDKEKTDAQFGIEISALKLTPGKAGFGFGLSHDFERDVNGYSTSVGNTSASGSYSNKPGISLTALTLNGNFMMPNRTYFFGGVNQSYLNLADAPAYLRLKSGIGFQAGIGFMPNEQFLVDVQYRAIRGKGDYNNGTYSGSVDKVEFDGVVLSARCMFL